MPVLIDTNILLDVLCNRPAFVEASKCVWRMCELGQTEGYISALSVPNIVYILRKELRPEQVKAIIDKISMIFRIADLKGADLKTAAVLGFDDYENAVQAACAKRIKAKYIITRNVRDFVNSPVPAVKPEGFIERS